jgi:hypothetical protein
MIRASCCGPGAWLAMTSVAWAPAHGVVVVPPPSYGLVERGLHRCAEPNELNAGFLEDLRLKTVVYLSAVSQPASQPANAGQGPGPGPEAGAAPGGRVAERCVRAVRAAHAGRAHGVLPELPGGSADTARAPRAGEQQVRACLPTYPAGHPSPDPLPAFWRPGAVAADPCVRARVCAQPWKLETDERGVRIILAPSVPARARSQRRRLARAPGGGYDVHPL